MRERSKIKSQGYRGAAPVSPSKCEFRIRLDEDRWGPRVDRGGSTSQQRTVQVLAGNRVLVHDPMTPSLLSAYHQKPCSCHIPAAGVGRRIQHHEQNLILFWVDLQLAPEPARVGMPSGSDHVGPRRQGTGSLVTPCCAADLGTNSGHDVDLPYIHAHRRRWYPNVVSAVANTAGLGGHLDYVDR